MKKKYIIFAALLILSLSSLSASISENIENFVSYAINNNTDYLSAFSQMENAKDDLKSDPLYYDSSMSLSSNISSDFSSVDSTTSLSIDIPILEQLSLNGTINSDLDGNIGFVYSPLNKAESTVSNEIAYQNSSIYLNEYKESLSLEITKAYLNYLISIEELTQQENLVENMNKIYEQDKKLYDLDEISLVDLQSSLLDYNETKNNLKDYNLAVYKSKLELYELLGINKTTNMVIPISDLQDVIKLTEELDTVISDKEFSVMSDYSVVEALNNIIVLEDSYDSLDLYLPTLNFSTNVSLDGVVSASVLFKTSYSDYNGDTKETLESEIKLSKKKSAAIIQKVQNEIDILKRTVESDYQSIENIKMEIEQNQLVLNEAKSLLDLDEYEVLDYETLIINANNINLNLIKAYIILYEDQLNLINYL